MVAATKTEATSTEAMSVFVAPAEPHVVVIESTFASVTITTGIEPERIEIMSINSPEQRTEADKVLTRLEALKPLVEDDDDLAWDLNAIMSDLADDMAWWDDGLVEDVATT
jgi:hypothetical protein